MKFKLALTYDGTAYFGWQKTKTDPSIQESLQQAIFRVSHEEVTPEAASRTDRGVHAEEQIVSFSLQKPWDPHRLLKALNAHLPLDIRGLSVTTVPDHFHPTLDAKSKEYHYKISNASFQEPIDRLYAWPIHQKLDLSLMQQAASYLLGTHDFTSFSGEEEKKPICTILSLDWEHLPRNRIQLILRGDRFLYKMARIIAGTLANVGQKKIAPDSIPHILAARDRKKGGVTAPSHGLFLHKIVY